MKSQFLTIYLVILYLVGCSGINEDTTVHSSAKSPQVAKSRLTTPSNIPRHKQIPKPINSRSSLQSQVPKLIKPAATPIYPKTLDPIYAAIPSKISVAESSQLNSVQVKQLVSLDKNNTKRLALKVIVPTYIPPGFQIDEFKAEEDFYGPTYTIKYRNSSNSCFEISSNFGGWGGEPTDYHNVEVSSPVLGKVILEYKDFEQNHKSYVGFKNTPVVIGKQGYFFQSPFGIGTSYQCNSISPQEAVKIVESLQYLNP